MSIAVKTNDGVKRVLGVNVIIQKGETFSFNNNCLFQYPETVTITDNVINVSNSIQALQNHAEITKLVIAPRETKLTLSERACQGCTGLTDVEIPSGTVIDIGNYAFLNCSALTNESVNELCRNVDTLNGYYTFSGCTSLTNITIPYTTGDFMFRGCTGLISVTLTDSSVATIASDAFLDCSSLASVTLPDTVTTINNGAFAYCAIPTFAFPNGLTTIGNHAFSHCGITEVDLPTSLTSLAYGSYPAFADCVNLTKVTLRSIPTPYVGPAGWWSNAGTTPFARCTAIEDFIVPNGWTESLYLAMTNNLTHDTLVGIIANLYDYSSGDAHTLTIGATNLAKLTAEEIAVATGKGWTVS